jgi:BlaI family penicillinase repressor
MKAVPRISETEWEIMRVIWAAAPRTAAQVIEALTRKDPSWHPKTIKTFLTRLVNKGALGYEKDGWTYL